MNADSGNAPMQTVVSVRHCEDYQIANVKPVLELILQDLGGLSSFVARGDRVILKPNLLLSSSPEKAVVTHPAVVEAVSGMLVDLGAKVFIGESPPLGKLQRALVKNGYGDFMERLGLEPVPFVTKQPQIFERDRLFKRIDLAAEIFEFDKVINIAKLKTHGQMGMTLAVKNLFGAVIGSDKATWHMRAGRDWDTFANVLVQICERVNPTLSIVDGVLGMEGNGPTTGKPRHLGILSASADPVALDATICRLLGLDPGLLKTCEFGQELGLGVWKEDSIRVVGDELQGFPLSDFETAKTMTMSWNMSRRNPLRRILRSGMVPWPEVDRDACKVCGVCVEHCPGEAMTLEKDGVAIDLKKCISCFCCHEFCVNKAVRIRTPALARFLSAITR